MEVDSGELPLYLRRFEFSCQQALKIKYTPNHPSQSILEQDWRSYYGTFSLSNQPLINKISPFMESIKHKEVYPITPFGPFPPWDQDRLSVNLTLTEYENKHKNPVLLKSVAMQLIDSYKSYIPIYTDGSKYPDGRTGIGLYSPFFPFKNSNFKEYLFSYRITDNQSIYTAELIAIKFALDTIHVVENQLNYTNNFIIYSDSLSALKSIQSGRSNGRPGLLYKVFKIYSKLKSHILFVWIPSHIGIPGNERANWLASQAIQNQQSKFQLNTKFKIYLMN